MRVIRWISTYSYNAANQLVSTRNPLTKVNEVASVNYYDAAGRLVGA